MQRAAAFLDEALHDVQSQPCALPRVFRGEVGLENLWATPRGNAGPLSLTVNPHQRHVLEIFHIQSRSPGASLKDARSSGSSTARQ